MKIVLQKLYQVSVVILAIFVLSMFALGVLSEENIGENFRVSGPQVQPWLQGLEIEEEDALTAQGLKEYCESSSAGLEGFCTGYLLGFFEAYDISSFVPICFNQSFRSSDQAEKALSNFMDDHPEHWKKPRWAVLAAALQDSFPCASQVSW